MLVAYIIRQFRPVDWQMYRDIRLEALQTVPTVFSSSYDEQSILPDEYWQGRLADEGCAYFGLFANEELIGMCGIIVDSNNTSEAELVAGYIKPEYRGKHLSRLFYEVRIEWARTNRIERLIISHRDSNISSKQANQHFGFQFTHRVPRLWHDGVWEDNLYYKLVL